MKTFLNYFTTFIILYLTILSYYYMKGNTIDIFPILGVFAFSVAGTGIKYIVDIVLNKYIK